MSAGEVYPWVPDGGLASLVQLESLHMNEPRRLSQFTIMAAISVVGAIAVLVACLVEIQKFRRERSFSRQAAANYAQLEKSERDLQAFYSKRAEFNNGLLDKAPQSPLPEVPRDRYFPSRDNRALIAKKTAFYKEILQSRDLSLALAAEAQIRADRYAKLRRKYADAAEARRIPFMPRPHVRVSAD